MGIRKNGINLEKLMKLRYTKILEYRMNKNFHILLNYLEASTKQAVGGFPVTNEAYEEAFTLLKNCYENPEFIISSHMNNLIKLEKVVNSNVKEIRNLFDRVKGDVRGLNTIGN